MPQYMYTAMDSKGKEQKGKIVADSETAAVAELKQKGMFPTSVKAVIATKKKKAAATYLYQANCDGAWGEIELDFSTKRIRIRKLAEWDTVKSHVYARKAIGFITLSEELPRKKRIVFERT